MQLGGAMVESCAPLTCDIVDPQAPGWKLEPDLDGCMRWFMPAAAFTGCTALFDLEHDIAVGMSRLKIQAHNAAKEKKEDAMHAALRARGRIGQMYAPVRVATDSLALCLMLMFRLEWYRFLREAGTITRLHEQEFVIATSCSSSRRRVRFATRNNGYRTMGVETLHTWLLDAQAALTTDSSHLRRAEARVASDAAWCSRSRTTSRSRLART